MPTPKKLVRLLKNYCWHFPKSLIAAVLLPIPKSLTLIGVTGTDGKTTTCTLIHQVLTSAGFRPGLISTITSPGLHTTSPDPFEIRKYLHKIHAGGCTHCVCEVTSHALDQFRYWGCHFSVSVITNISHEHLDYHATLSDYLLAKSKIFLQSDSVVLNRDDPSFSFFSTKSPRPITTYGIKNKSDFQAKITSFSSKGIVFSVNGQSASTDSPYLYQLENILAALAATTILQIDSKYLFQTIRHFPATPGRRQEIKNRLKIKTIIDFAHTPNGLKATLSSLKKTISGRLIVIFGATGGRDQTKRPIMGRVVSQLADIAVITADDTRHEKIEDINRQIIAGIDQKNKNFTYYDIPNRQDAFNLAIKLARPGDTVIACGKGHETTILHGSTEYPWSEAEAFRTAFRLKKN